MQSNGQLSCANMLLSIFFFLFRLETSRSLRPKLIQLHSEESSSLINYLRWLKRSKILKKINSPLFRSWLWWTRASWGGRWWPPAWRGCSWRRASSRARWRSRSRSSCLPDTDHPRRKKMGQCRYSRRDKPTQTEKGEVSGTLFPYSPLNAWKWRILAEHEYDNLL